MKFVPGCACCCGFTATINVSGYCGSIFLPVHVVDFRVARRGGRHSAGHQTGTSVSFTGIDGSLSYKVRQSRRRIPHGRPQGRLSRMRRNGDDQHGDMAVALLSTVHVQPYDGYDGV